MAAKKTTSKPSPKASTIETASEPIAPPTPDIFETMGKKSIFICLGIISLIAFFVFKDFILIKKMFLYKDIGSDTLNGVLPYFYYIADYIEKNGLPRWSFAVGMGQSIFAGFTRDPFEIISFLAGTKSIPYIFIFIEILKILIGGLVFYTFLLQLKVSRFAATVGAMLFSFSGFMMIGACWYIFTYEALTIAVMLLGFELLYQKQKWFLFVISIFMVSISMPFNLYIFGLFLATYAAFRILQEPDYTHKKLMIVYAKMIGLGAVGMLLSGPFLLETIFQLLESPRGSGGNSYFAQLSNKSMFGLIEKEQFGASIMRMFSSDLLGSGSNYSINGVVENGQLAGKNWGNFLEAPLSYCGILSMVLMAQVFTFVSKASRKWYIIFLVLWLVPTIFPYFRYILWLFTGDYYRVYSFFIALVFLIYTAQALDLIIKNRKVNVIVLAVSVVLLLILISYPYFKDYQKLVGGKQLVDDAVSLFAKVFIIAYGALIFLLAKAKNQTNLKYALIAVVAFELIYLSGLTVNRRDTIMARELKEKVMYNDYSIEAVAAIKEKEKAPFYRIDKNYFSSGASNFSLNDHWMHGYYSTSSYNSWAQMNYINYLKSYGVISKDNEYEARWVSGFINPPNRPIPLQMMETFNSVKYILAKRDPRFFFNPNWKYSYDSLTQVGDVVILRNKFALPFGYTYDSYLPQSSFDKLNITQKEFVTLSACILKDEDVSLAAGLKPFQLKDTVSMQQFTLENYKAKLDLLRKDTLTMDLFSENKFTGKANVSENKIMYLSFPNDKGWHLKVDGKETEKLFVNCGMTGIYLTKGTHTIEFDYHLRFMNKGLMMSLAGSICCGGLFFLFRRKKQE